MTFIVMSPPSMESYIAQGTLLNTFCSGTTLMGTYADGSGNQYQGTIAVNSAQCGYVPPPPAGTLLNTFCSGTTLMGNYADGSGGQYQGTIAINSAQCGYVLQGNAGVLRVNVGWTGNCDIDIHLASPDGYFYGYGLSGGGTGVWDHDSTTAGQENVAFNPTTPFGAYVLDLINYNGNDPSVITVNIIYSGTTYTLDLTGTVPQGSRANGTRSVQFSINAAGFTVTPHIV